ncbi:MAG: hypothetical protein CVU56_24845 [Deltaproteobacteria bacterium HGW-Deltaproteobacteria-14]|jgi:hypothetical protein|nr:MAG: hypothetical protein CVU56_24845 [Deltaproteobacteria bacterium HGW-Deltaproteobacteria-14]
MGKRWTVLALGLLLGGCTTAQLHTARTTAVGELDVTLGLGYLHNELIAERGGTSVENAPLHLAARTGLGERVDLGVRAILGDGLLVDTRLGLLPPSSPWQLSVGVGVGVGGWLGQGGGVSITAPIVAMASYDVGDVLTPYVGLGWASWWHLGHEPTLGQAGDTYAARAGHGDGVVTLLVGLAVHLSPTLSILVEYDYTTQVLDDPGDFFSMVDSHVFAGAVTF